MSCCRLAINVDVEVPGHDDVAVVEVVVVDGVVVMDDEAAQSRRRKKLLYVVDNGVAVVDDAPCGCQRVSSAMSPPVLPGPKETLRAL